MEQSQNSQNSIPEKKIIKDDKEISIKSYWWPEQSNIASNDITFAYKKFILEHSLHLISLVPVFFLLVYCFRDYLNVDMMFFIKYLNFLNEERNFPFYYELSICIIIATFIVWYICKPKDIYIVDFSVWPGKKDWEMSNLDFVDMTKKSAVFNKESEEFQEKMSKRTGVGDHTYLPPGPTQVRYCLPPELNMSRTRAEFAEIMFSTIDNLLKNTAISPQEIDILVVNCSLFCPTPSLAAMVINHYKMRTNILSFNLGGMGCSAGIIAIDLAKDMLQVHKNSRALVVSTETITQAWYRGNERGMMLQNALFRCGGAAILLSNKWSDSWFSKYKLMHTVRVHKGQSNDAYNSVYQEEDIDGWKGVRLSKDLMNVVGDALKTNMTELGPLVLPWSEQFLFFFSLVRSKIYKKLGKKPPPPYMPDFKKAFQHFCIHAGGRAIIDGLEQNLKLTERQIEPSRATLFRYGNTSSSSVWYELAYSERMGYISKGDKIWQIALGSGFKCNSAVWKSLRDFGHLAAAPPHN